MDELDEAMERLIDDYGLLGVMMSAAEICRLKAAHVQVNWQDKPLAARWVKAAKKLESMEGVLAATRNQPAPKPMSIIPDEDALIG